MENRCNPLISVIMCVHNTKEEYLNEAVKSILNQTYDHLELIIIDDGSDAWCHELLCRWQEQDDRIHFYTNEQNIGLTKSLNLALSYAKGAFIARMDSDDLCVPERLERQLKYFLEHKDIDVLASGTYINDGSGSIWYSGAYRRFEQERMRIRLSFANIEFVHPSVMFRADFLEKNHITYDESVAKAQDYAMWSVCIEKGKLGCVQEPLFISRIHEEQIGVQCISEQSDCADVTKARALRRLIPEPTKRQEQLYVRMRDTALFGEPEENIALVKELVEQNQRRRVYNDRSYREELFFWWLRKSLYGENREKGRQILKNPYMRRNIARILFTELFRYLLDRRYEKQTKKRWHRSIIDAGY